MRMWCYGYPELCSKCIKDDCRGKKNNPATRGHSIYPKFKEAEG